MPKYNPATDNPNVADRLAAYEGRQRQALTWGSGVGGLLIAGTGDLAGSVLTARGVPQWFPVAVVALVLLAGAGVGQTWVKFAYEKRRLEKACPTIAGREALVVPCPLFVWPAGAERWWNWTRVLTIAAALVLLLGFAWRVF
jgi:hypothetical protein